MSTAHHNSKHFVTAVIHRRSKSQIQAQSHHAKLTRRGRHSLDEESAGAGSKSELSLLVRLQGPMLSAPSSRPRREMLYSCLDVTRQCQSHPFGLTRPGVRTRGCHCSTAGTSRL